MKRVVRVAALAIAGSATVAGCGFHGDSSLPAPFAKGGGANGMTITVQMADVENLVPHAEVKVNDVTVGTVSSIKADDWHAVLTVKLDKGVSLPSNATATIGQKSLLGAEYLSLGSPSTGATGALANGSTIPISSTGRYPETEEVLTALSTVLNGSGIAQVHTITAELDQALDGNQANVRAMLTNLNTFVAGLNAQKQDISDAITKVNALAGTLAAGNQTLATGIDQIGPGLAVLQQNRVDLTNTLTAIGNLGTTANKVIAATQSDLVGTLQDLQPVLKALGDAQDNLVGAAGGLATYPFPLDTASRMFRGDYVNLFAAIDVRCSTLVNNFIAGTAALGSLLPQLCPGEATTTLSPLTAPLTAASPKSATPSTPTATPSTGSLLGGLGNVLNGALGGSKSSTPSSTPTPSATTSSGSSGGLLGGLLGGGH